jgi:predicted acyltransferase
LCYGAAALIVLHTSWRTQVKIVLAILLGYWAVLSFIPAPGGAAGDLSPEGNLAGWLDRSYLPGKILPEYYGHGDNEGYLSTIPSVATVLLGALAGRWLKSPRPWGQLVLGLAGAGMACVALGLAWGQVFPIIKNIWTSSFVLLAGGLSLLLLAFFYGVIDGLGWKAWAFPFIVIGSNAIFIYVAPGLVPFDATARALFGGFARHSGVWGPFILVTATFVLEWLVLWFLYRKKWFLRV